MNEQGTSRSQAQPLMCDTTEARPRWDDCGLEEKIERLRATLLHLSPDTVRTRQMVDRLREHRHDEQGRLLVPFDAAEFRVYQDSVALLA